MKWSLKIARLAGIDVRVHVTFPLILIWVAFMQYRAFGTTRAAVAGILFVLAVFATVVLHEMGHSLVARRFGVKTREITLWPIGGVSRLERMPEDPKREFLIAGAGPLVSIAVAAVLFALHRGLLLTGYGGDTMMAAGGFVWRLAWVNVLLAVFNMLPAFPMDGGRVLRAALASRMPYARATRYASRVGQVFALLLGILGLFWSPILLFIALFVWIGASAEGAEAQIRSGLEGIPVRAAMVTDFRSLAPDDPLSRATELILAGAQEDFPVLAEGRLVGVLTRNALLKALAEAGSAQPVSSVMDRHFETADPSEMLGDVLPRMRAGETHTVPVVRDEQLLGLLTPENVSDFLSIQAATQRARPRPGHAAV